MVRSVIRCTTAAQQNRETCGVDARRHSRRRATHIPAPAKMAKTPATRKISSRVDPGTKNPIVSNTTPTAMLIAGFRLNMLAS